MDSDLEELQFQISLQKGDGAQKESERASQTYLDNSMVNISHLLLHLTLKLLTMTYNVGTLELFHDIYNVCPRNILEGNVGEVVSQNCPNFSLFSSSGRSGFT